MTGGFLDGDIFRGLAFRILVFLTLALLPFGLIAVVQTREIARQAESNAELSLLALTDQAASVERSILQEGFGAAQALSALTQLYGSDQRACSAFLEAYRRAAGLYSFIGFLPANGKMTCSSASQVFDFTPYPGFTEGLIDPKRRIIADQEGPISNEPVLVLSQPFFTRAGLAGFITMSVPLDLIATEMSRPLAGMPAELVTFNAVGDIVRADRDLEQTLQDLPMGRDLSSFVGDAPFVFQADNMLGEDRIYAVVPVVGNVAYTMSIWEPEKLGANLSKSVGLSVFLPVLMWLASLVVAFWSLNRLAVRHIRKLGRQMRHFAYNRRVPRTTMGQGVPRELVEIQKSFVRMADSIVRDEAALEDSLRDKNILLKEVHHRVKNNLQLISSIMNMQIRRAQTDDARLVLKRLQDRILSLATVHKNLYQTENLDRVDAGHLIEEIISQLLAAGLSAGKGVRVTQHYDSIQMDADDAAPLTLLISEALTNALKYIGEPMAGGVTTLDISLRRTTENEVIFRIENTTSGAQGTEGTGLGTQLIDAFARQLNGRIEVGFDEDKHMLQLTFPMRQRVKDSYDF